MEPDTNRAAEVRAATLDDADAVAAIYSHYARETIVTFEERAVSEFEMAKRIGDVLMAGLPWLVAESADRVLGFAHATRWKRRSAYRFAAETTVYVDPECTGAGIGSALYRRLLAELAALDFHVVIGGIALPNDASVHLHEKLGFHKVAHFEQVGFKQGRWVDVGYWQRSLSGTVAT